MRLLRSVLARLLSASLLVLAASSLCLAQAPASAPAVARPAKPAQAATKETVQPPAFRVKLGPPIPVSAIRKVTEVEGITEYRLENGLKVLLFPDLSKPTITVNITYLVGSRHENYGETGMAHLLE
ncbi:MAG TPA: hypothetical protein VLS49_17470, partial [Usitatibacter sp.]|nr:hypothetical protein [Usitatibacter sp.]